MARLLNWIFVALLIYAAYRLLLPHNDAKKLSADAPQITDTNAPTPTATPLTKAEPTISHSSAQPAAPKIVVAPTPLPNGAPGKLPKNAVPFRLINGLMVSYGDVVLGRPTIDEVPESGFAESPKPKPWNSDIAYLVSPDLENPEAVYKTIEYFNENTTIRFVPADETTKDAIVFEPTENHCYSYLGRIGGHQPVYLSKNCNEPEVTHELMHVLGFVHEQSRPDRDKYVHIHWDKIENDKKDQFYEVPDSLASNIMNRPFDYNSVMLYLPTAFAAKPGETTMESVTEVKVDPVRTGLSREDLARIQSIYPAKASP